MAQGSTEQEAQVVDYAPEEVQSLVHNADTRLRAVAQATSRVMNDLFSGRDPGYGYLTSQYFDTSRVTAPWVYPEISANLFQTRLREIVVDLVPALPKMECEALTIEAVALEEDQSLLSNWGSRHGNLKQAIRDAAMFGPMGTHFGMRLWVDKEMPLHKRFCYKALSHTECGYEPGMRRFVWHRYDTEGAEAENALQVTEVFFPNKADTGYTVYRYELDRSAKTSSAGPKQEELGMFMGAEEVDAACPVRIGHFLTAPPGEDIPPVECMSWVPLIRALQATLEAIDRETNSINNVILFDDSIEDDHIKAMADNKTGNTAYIPIKFKYDDRNGVAQKVRPVERNSALAELLTVKDAYMQMLDDVIGTSPLQRGAAVGPRKSAAEASILSSASDRRTRDRLSVIAELLADLEQAKYTWQPIAYGKKVDIPLGGGLVRTLKVPDPQAAQMAFTVDVVELGNLSKQGQIETYAAATTIMGNTYAQFQGEPPTPVKEATRRYLKALGAPDIADMIKDPVLAGGPQERYIAYLQNPGAGILVDPNDPPEPFLLYYNQLRVDPHTSTPAKEELARAIARYNAASRPTAQPSAPVPGVNPLGAPQSALPSENVPLL